jgi:hypothetical protein
MEASQGNKADEFAQLREDFPGWYFWRARTRGDLRGRSGSWMATRTDISAGVEPTLMARDEPALRALLTPQRGAAKTGGKAPAVATSPDAFWNPAYF